MIRGRNCPNWSGVCRQVAISRRLSAATSSLALSMSKGHAVLDGQARCLDSKQKLELGQVHIWKANLDQDAAPLDSLLEKLDYDERDRASRFHHRLDRSRYVMSRWVLREILGSLLSVEPEKLYFSYTSQGKPYLPDSNGVGNLAFNMARSGGLAIYAVTRGLQVGIDIEKLRSVPYWTSVARHFFSSRELETLESLPENEQDRAFFACWTRKEAFLKAVGTGLGSYPLDSFDVSLRPGEPARLLDTRSNPEDVQRWSLVDVNPRSEYVAALCMEKIPSPTMGEG